MSTHNVEVTLRWVTEARQALKVEADSEQQARAAAVFWADQQSRRDYQGFGGDAEHEFHIVYPREIDINTIDINSKGEPLDEIETPMPPDYAVFEFGGDRWALFGPGPFSCHGAFLVDAFPKGLPGLKGSDWYKTENREPVQEKLPQYINTTPSKLPDRYVDRRYLPLLVGAELSDQARAIAARRDGRLVALVNPLYEPAAGHPDSVHVGGSAQAVAA